MSHDSSTNEESHMNMVLHFLDALRLLSIPPDELLAMDRSPFLPWELQHEVMDVIPALISGKTPALTAAEASGLQSLAARLHALPTEAISGGDALKHPAWMEVRAEARDVLRVLRPTMDAVDRYFA
jgi:hypothetical protein